MNDLAVWLQRAIDDRVGEGAAFATARNHGAVSRRARDLAEEAVARARAQAFAAHGQGRIRGEAHLRNFIQRAAVHRVTDLLRRDKRNQQFEGELSACQPAPSYNEFGRGPLESALAGLSRPDRLLVRLYHFEGLTYQELADLQGVSLTAVYGRLRNIRRRLRCDLEAVGFEG